MQYHRVTEVLYPFSGLQYVQKEVIDRAATRGTYVHSACEGIMRGLGNWESPEGIQGYVDSFMSWWGKGREIVDIERRFYDDEYMLTGQVDALIKMHDGIYVVDLKTSANPSKTWPLQGSAYAYLARKAGYEIKGMVFLKLNREGENAREYRYEEEWDMYLKCFEVYKRFFAKSARFKR